jgi:periplasmic protein TonB
MSNATIINNPINSTATAVHYSMFSRLGAIPSGLVATFCLLYVMYSLVHRDYPMAVPTPVPVMPPIIMEEDPQIEVRETTLPIKPIEQVLPPKTKIVEPIEVDTDPGFHMNERVVAVIPPPSSMFGGGGQMVPFIKIAPQYPTAAAAKGTEGYVDIMFDVTALGTTDNIRIVAYVPSTVFNRSVIKAVKGWKYKPNVVDGVPVKTLDVKDRVRFSMEKK